MTDQITPEKSFDIRGHGGYRRFNMQDLRKIEVAQKKPAGSKSPHLGSALGEY